MTINKTLINSFIKTTEKGAYGASLYRGKNDKIAADKAAVDEMRKVLIPHNIEIQCYISKINPNGIKIISSK